jgi:tRNA uridine 5-carboxymethylaminomethyl modification enzyme
MALRQLLETAGVEIGTEDAGPLETADIELKYAGYLLRERIVAQRITELHGMMVPDGIDFRSLRSLSTEAREKLCRLRPDSIGAAARISGVSASDVQMLALEVQRLRRE